MLKTFEETVSLIHEGKLLHISGTGALLERLPKGDWIGGSTEYFTSEGGGRVSGDVLDVHELDFREYKFASYDAASLPQVTRDVYPNGFSIIILPFDSEVHRVYAENASEFEGMFLTNILGWISGVNLGIPGQTPVAANGSTGETFRDKAVVLHIALPEGKTAMMNIINIFEPDESGPVITFSGSGFSAEKCRLDGAEIVFADYIHKNGLDTKLPLVGDYSGAGVNISIKSIENGVVNFYAPVFTGINYRFAKDIPDYVGAFQGKIRELGEQRETFTCNCILNFLYGGLEGKDLGGFYGPITFGEVAWQLLNQTLVYLQIV